MGLMRSLLFTKQKYKERQWINQRVTSWRNQRVPPQNGHLGLLYEELTGLGSRRIVINDLI